MSSTIAFINEGHFIRHVRVQSQTRQGGKSHVGFLEGLRVVLQVLRLVVVFHPLRIFLPIALVSFVTMVMSLAYDFWTSNISDTTLFFLTISIVVGCFGFMSDQIAHIRREIYSE